MTNKVTWGGFSKKTLAERLEHLEKNELISVERLRKLKKKMKLLSLETANQMAENVLGTFHFHFH